MKKILYLFSFLFVLLITSCETHTIITEEESDGSFWKGKRILWLGTSIPEGGGKKSYPIYVGEKLGAAAVYNEAEGGSTIRAYLYNGSWVNMFWYGVSRSLSQTIAEKELFLKYYTSGLDESGNIVPGGKYGWRDLCPGSPSEMSKAEVERILNCSYENKLVHKYLDSHHPDFIAHPDIIVIDHGYNDLAHGIYDRSQKEAIAVPEDIYDRRTYIGATNYIIKVIRDYYPDQKIILIGHFEDEYVPRIHLAQLNLFDFWKDEYPGFRLWEKLGWTQDINPETGLTYLQTNLPDNLHPHTDPRVDPETGYKLAIKQIGDACVEFFEHLYDGPTDDDPTDTDQK